MSFSMVGKPPFPRPQSDGFPQGIQWQAEGVDLGDRHVQTVNLVGFGTGGATRDEDTLTVVAPAGGGGGGGVAPTDAVGFSARLAADQTAGATVVFGSDGAPGFNTGGYSTVTGIFTVPADQGGVWRFSAAVEVSNGGGEGSPAFVEVEIALNGTSYGHDEALVGDSAMLKPYCEIVVGDGDQILCKRSGASWTGTVTAVGATYTRFQGLRVGDAPAGG